MGVMVFVLPRKLIAKQARGRFPELAKVPSAVNAYRFDHLNACGNELERCKMTGRILVCRRIESDCTLDPATGPAGTLTSIDVQYKDF
jgi:hypothetical protein